MIDTTKIQGYAEMSAEDKIKALENYEFEGEKELAELKETNGKLKNANNKISSEVADYKRQLREKQSEDERKQAEIEELNKAKDEELATLRKEKQIAELKSQYSGLGYAPELADEMAQALSEGDMKKVAEIQKKHIENCKTQWAKESLNGQPNLSNGDKKKPMTKEEIMKIKDSKERQKAIADNINLFQK